MRCVLVSASLVALAAAASIRTFPPSEQLCPGSQITTEERDQVLAVHNDLRAAVSNGNELEGGIHLPRPATPLPFMEWDCALESAAQDWINKCEFQHSDDNVGENLWHVTANAPLKADGMIVKAAKAWASTLQRVSDWKSTVLSLPMEPALSATQMLWNSTTKIGCAAASCKTNDVYVICRYADKGNFMGDSMYQFIGEDTFVIPTETGTLAPVPVTLTPSVDDFSNLGDRQLVTDAPEVETATGDEESEDDRHGDINPMGDGFEGEEDMDDAHAVKDNLAASKKNQNQAEPADFANEEEGDEQQMGGDDKFNGEDFGGDENGKEEGDGKQEGEPAPRALGDEPMGSLLPEEGEEEEGDNKLPVDPMQTGAEGGVEGGEGDVQGAGDEVIEGEGDEGDRVPTDGPRPASDEVSDEVENIEN